MKKVVDDNRFIIKVCDLYYNQKLTHLQIAEKLNISRPTVSRLLSAAVDKNIVTIQVNYLETVKYWELEQELKNRYGLYNVVIVEAKDDDTELKRALGNAARKYMQTCIKDGDIVGISMGTTLYNTVYSTYNSLEQTAKAITVVPLIGGMGQLKAELHSNPLAENLAKDYNGEFIPLYAPARLSNTSLRNQLKKEQSVKRVFQLYKELTVAIVGIGYPNDNSAIKATGYYKANEIQSLIARKVVGEICMQFYDVQGTTDSYENDNKVIGIDLSKLKKVPYSIGIAGGIDKVPAIEGAVCGGYINVLITDNQCAEMLLKAKRGK